MSTENVRTNILSGSPLEPLRGYSRAVVAGNTMWISGTTAMTPKGDILAPGDAYEQTKAILTAVRSILQSRGFQLSDVMRTRLFVTNISKWEDYARAHREFFEKIRPASSMVQVAKLVDARLMIEMEVDAVKGFSEIEQVGI